MTIKKRWSKKHNRQVWGFDARIEGHRVRRFGFASRDAAQLALSRARLDAMERAHGLRPPDLPEVTVRALVLRRAAQLQDTVRRRTSARGLLRWLDTLPAGLLVTELTTSRLHDYTDARLRSVKPQTVFRELTDICSCLNRARDLFPALEDWTPPRRPRVRVSFAGRDRVITPDEAARILSHLRRPRAERETECYHRVRRDAADLFQIALLTAARRWEILSLRWSDVNWEWRTLSVTGTKPVRRVRVVPISDALLALLRRRKADAGDSPLVFPILAGTTLLRANTDQIYRAACSEIGMPYGRDVPGGWVLHDARHTAITAMLHAGNSLESVMAISGHSARVMALRYAHSTERTRRAAVAALDAYVSGGFA